MYMLTHVLTQLLIDHPRAAGLFGLLFAVVFAFLGFFSWQELQEMPQEPLQLSLAEAITAVQSTGEEMWVQINEVVWDCGNIVRDGDDTRALFSDEGHSVLGVAMVSRSQSTNVTCADLSPVDVRGVLQPLGQGTYDRLENRGFDLKDYGAATARVGLCMFCGRSNSTIGLTLSAVMVLVGLVLYPVALFARRRRHGV